MSTMLLVSGPTGVGKSALAALVARRLGGEIVCADSRQLYRGMPVGSAQPEPGELAGVPHHLYETLDPGTPCSAGAYRDLALPVIRAIAARGRMPIVVGGTGLYLRALTGTWSLAPAARPETLSRLEASLAAGGAEALWRELARDDPETAGRLHPRDGYRIVRALAVLGDTGRPISAWRRAEASGATGDDGVRHAALVRPRPELYRRINARAARMVAGGMLDEARRLSSLGLDAGRPPLNAIGFRHLFAVLAGGLDVGTATELLARDSRRYAKRQLTWLRSQPGLAWIEAGDAGAADALEAVARA